MSEKIITASITGIDGSGKTTTANTVARMLSETYSVGVLASLRNFSYVTHNGKQEFLFPELSSKVALLYEKGQGHNPLALFASCISHVVLQGRLIEPHITRKYDPDFLITDRNRLVDSIIMFNFYGITGIPIGVMATTVEAIGGKSTVDDVILLTVTPEKAHIRAKRGKKFDNHEYIESLIKMANIYPWIIVSLKSMGRIKTWTSINSEENQQASVSQAVYSRLIARKA